MVNYVSAFSQPESGKYFERIIMIFNELRETLRGPKNKTSKQEWNNKVFTVKRGENERRI